jgi:3',5'-cyclic AMP phosphodiesterase CpdA
MNSLQIAIVSDLHAFDDPQGKEDPSYLSIALPDNEPGKHPIAALIQLIGRESLRADLLLCGGDIGDKARPAAIKFAWASLERVRKALDAERLAITTGNHDYDSRHAYNSFDAKGVLQALDPPYPLPHEADNDKYWARNFVFVEGAAYRLVVLNSSAYHGQGSDEVEHGRVSDATLERLKAGLITLAPKPVNILLCHHHPKPHSELGLGEADTMRNGQQLLDLPGVRRLWVVDRSTRPQTPPKTFIRRRW